MRWLSPFIVVVVLLSGCSSKEAKFAGTYEPHYTAADGASTPVTGTTLELRPDGTFKQEGFPMIEGKWRISGDKLVLQPSLKAGMGPKQAGLSTPEYDPIEMELDGSGGSLLERADPGGFRTVWKRK